MTRVILLGPAPPVPGGMAAVLDGLASSSLRENFDLAILNTGKTTPFDRPWHVAVLSQLRLLKTLTAMLMHGHGRLVHIHTCSGFVFWRDVLFLVLARLFGSKVVWHIHGGGFADFIESLPSVRRSLLALAVAMSDAVIVLSESWRTKLGRYVRPPRWAIVENGVRLRPASESATRTDVFLFVGTLDDKKGAADLIAATAIASKKGFGGRIRMAGGETSPGQIDRLRELCGRKGILHRIELLGMVSGQQKIAMYEEACAFVLPSYVEGLPMALLEAMAFGLPVIVTEVGAIPEVVTDGVEGFVIKSGDVEALASRMMQLWDDAARRERMGAAARKRVEEGYTLETMAAKVADVYRAIIEG